VVIPTGVDETLFFPHPEEAEEFKRKLAVRHAGFGEGPLLVYIGRIGQEKNLTLLADAMVRIVGEAPDTNLLMVGDGPRKAELRQAFRQRGLEEHVAWLGFLPRSRLPAIYSAADIFVFPSKTETQGLVTIEAMLCGTPVVGMNIMGTAEILQGDVGGLLTEDNPLDFAKKVLHLLRDPALRAAKSAEALRHAQRYTIGNSCDQMEQLYTRIFRK
jgi:glycosyltransferase involved in cell wall biosynthesis